MSKTRGGYSLVLSLLLAGTAACSDSGGTEPPVADSDVEASVEAGDETAVDSGADVEEDTSVEETAPDADDAALDATETSVADSADADDTADGATADAEDSSATDAADTSVADSADTSVADAADSAADSAADATDAADAADTGISCTVAGDCPGVDTECAKRDCVSNKCTIAFTTAGTVLTAQTAGDCKTAQCDGSGGITQVANGTDLPNDGNDCTDDVCTGTTPSNPPKSASTVCGAGGTKVCDGAGACVECVSASTCPGVDDDCKTRTCTSNVCGFSYRSDGTAVSTQTAGDCKKVVCDGAGATKTIDDNTDVNDDSNVCTTDACSSGTPTHTPVATGTDCGGGKKCDSAGSCVGCVTKDDCAGTDDDCKVRTCTSGVCGFAYTADLTPVTAQTAGDCKKVVCDGAGGTKTVDDNTDVNDDSNVCTTDACSSGTPTHTPVSSGTDCGGGKKCNTSGTCVECLAASDCPGTDTECATRTCVSNTCGWSYASAGTVLTTQTAGDCKEKQCNGSGVIVDVNADIDVPVDGNACTNDVCTAGVPSNPLKAEGDSCPGGGLCTATGACVQCLTATNCPSTGSECAVPTCVSNVCGVSNVSAGVATSSQTTGDCKENQCDGAGNVVSVTASLDVPADDGNTCTTETCSGSTPVHAAVADHTACSTGFCSSGTCVACISAADCPGTDTECATRTCVSNTCGWSYATAGTPLSSGLQTVGDCQEKQCDGVGNITSVAADIDVNVDGNQCTNDVCTSGVPSNPPATIGTACTSGGGKVCDGASACVECNYGTDCATGVCSSNVCQAATCADGVKNGSETDVDCGGGTCGTCASGKTCSVDGDCASGNCLAGTCAANHLVISEIQTRGSNGGNDEFIEIYNPTKSPVTFDSTWTISARSAAGTTCATNAVAVRYTGVGQVIPAGGHLLVTNNGSSGYNGAVAGDATYNNGINDAASVVLYKGTTVIDAMCFYVDATTQTNLTTCSTPYVCEGTPIQNNHDNTTGTNADRSLERKPGGTAGNGQDTDVTATDFTAVSSSTPQNLSSTTTP